MRLRPDHAALGRALQAAVRTHKLLTVTEARLYAELVGLSGSILDSEEGAAIGRGNRNERWL